MSAAIHIQGDELSLNFPSGRFHDTVVRDLYTSPERSDAGTVQIRAWTQEEITRYHVQSKVFDLVGARVANLINDLGYSVHNSGLVQRLARRLDVPLVPPVDRSTYVGNCTIIGR